MKRVFYVISLIFFLVSCSTSRLTKVPMTEEMYQATKKNYLKKYTKNFINSIPEKDLNLLISDTLLVIYDTSKPLFSESKQNL
jgi:major membrane immunogen (membrane-anchored lipoprotein)